MRSALLRAGLAVLLVLSADPSHAFNSFPPGAPHDQITKVACDSLGLSRFFAVRLEAAVRRPDWTEFRWSPGLWPSIWLRIRVNRRYRPEHHFDRAPGVSDSAIFVRSAAYVHERLNAAVALARAGAGTRWALRPLGSALHALQDLESHSNFVDLDFDDRVRVVDAVWRSGAAPPRSLKITGFDPAAEDPENPPGDPYPHGAFSKDASWKNRESRLRISDITKYELAKLYAIEQSVRLLRQFRRSLTPAEWRRLTTSAESR